MHVGNVCDACEERGAVGPQRQRCDFAAPVPSVFHGVPGVARRDVDVRGNAVSRCRVSRRVQRLAACASRVMMTSRDGSQREGPDDSAHESSPREGPDDGAREGSQREGPDDDASPWSEAFKQQFSDELLQRLEIFTARRLAGIGKRVTQGHEQQAREIVASVIFQTTRGLVRWHPDRQGLESHFKAAIKRQTSLDWKRSKRIREESLDATDADGYSAVREEVESLLQERFPDPASTQRAARAVEEIERIAAADPDFAAFFDARADGLRARAVMRRTGLSPARYRRCRRLLAGALDRVSFDVRPWRRKRESQS